MKINSAHFCSGIYQEKNIYVEDASEKVFREIHNAIAAVINQNPLRLACGHGYTE